MEPNVASNPASTPDTPWLPWVVVVAVTVLYLATAPSWVLGGDNGEFATLGFEGGVAHPSGYPLYILYLRAMSWLPGAEPAHTAALATALLGGPIAWVLQRACRAWGAGATASAIAVILFATGPLPFLIFTQAEVFALNTLLSALVVWLAADAGPLRGVARAAVLAAIAGLALSNHLSAIWLAPIGLYGFGLGVLEAERRWLPVVVAPLCLLAGLLPYLSLLSMADSAGWVWGHPTALDDVLGHFLRRDYGSLTLAAEGTENVTLANLGSLALSLGRSTLFAPALVGLGALGLAIARPANGQRAAWIALATTFLAAGPVFIALFNIPPVALGLHVVQRFHILPAMLLIVPTAIGLSQVTAWFARDAPLPAVMRDPIVSVGAILICGAFAAVSSSDAVQTGHSRAVARYLDNTLAQLPPDTIMIGIGDHRLFGFLYNQRALGQRPDVLYVDYELLVHPWYQERITKQLGSPVVPPGDAPNSVRMVSAMLASGRPVVLAEPVNDAILAAFPSWPEGTIIHLMAPGQSPPPPQQIMRLNEGLYTQYTFDYVFPTEAGDWSSAVHHDYQRSWASLAGVFSQLGEPEDAAVCSDLARRFAPWIDLPPPQ